MFHFMYSIAVRSAEMLALNVFKISQEVHEISLSVTIPFNP